MEVGEKLSRPNRDGAARLACPGVDRRIFQGAGAWRAAWKVGRRTAKAGTGSHSHLHRWPAHPTAPAAETSRARADVAGEAADMYAKTMAAAPSAGTLARLQATTTHTRARGARTCQTTPATCPCETAPSSGGAAAHPTAPAALMCGEFVSARAPRNPVSAASGTPAIAIAVATAPRSDLAIAAKGARSTHRASTGAANPSPDASHMREAEPARSEALQASGSRAPPVSTRPSTGRWATRVTTAPAARATAAHRRVEARHRRSSAWTRGPGASMRARLRSRRARRTSPGRSSRERRTDSGALRALAILRLPAWIAPNMRTRRPLAFSSPTARRGSLTRSRRKPRTGPPTT